ncbi:MAG TPA: hypothetical protein VF829_00810 [Candidatus Paceibacterota bacterium]
MSGQVAALSEDVARGITFKINRDSGKVQGFTLKGVGDTEAEAFCLSFVTAQQKNKATVTFAGGKIIFTHGGVSVDEMDPQLYIWGQSRGGVFSADITPEDQTALENLLYLKGEYEGATTRIKFEMAWGKGFTFYTKRD